jgi:hypothetical protein
MYRKAYENARPLLKAVPGLKIVEMEHNGENALCCGGIPQGQSQEIFDARRRLPLQEAQATGAGVLATVCTGCQKSMAPLEEQYGLEVCQYTSLIAESVGVRQPDRLKRLIRSGSAASALKGCGGCISANGYTRAELEQPVGEIFAASTGEATVAPCPKA